MSKPKINRQGRKPLTRKRLVQLMEQHLQDTAMMDAFAFPRFLPEEDARSRYLADSIIQNLSSQHEPSPHPGISPEAQAARIRNNVILQAYRMVVAGGIQFLKSPAVPIEGPSQADPEIDHTQDAGVPYSEALERLEADRGRTQT